MAAPKAYRSAVKLRTDRSILGKEPPDPPRIGEGVMWSDPASGAPKVNFKVRDTAGNIRTGSITLT